MLRPSAVRQIQMASDSIQSLAESKFQSAGMSIPYVKGRKRREPNQGQAPEEADDGVWEESNTDRRSGGRELNILV